MKTKKVTKETREIKKMQAKNNDFIEISGNISENPIKREKFSQKVNKY